MNPCPCGYLGDPKKSCRCTREQVQKYRARISGPLLDRIDLQIEVPALAKHLLINDDEIPESSANVKQRVIAAQTLQYQRQANLNALLTNDKLKMVCQLDKALQTWLHEALEKLQLSNRAYHRILKLARTIADLANHESLTLEHLAEAIQYRRLN
jgi:magnesium chelatase family protein